MSSTLNDYFDKIVCINLDIRKDRWRECRRLFNRHNLNVERLPAIYGKMLNIYERPEQGAWYPGYVGCGLSHLFAMKYAKQLNLKNILIFEDDIEFIEDINEVFHEIKGEIPNDWNMIYFGGSHHCVPQKISKHIYKTINLLTAHAIAINGNYFDTVIESITNIDTPVDVNYQKLQEHCNAYVTRPHLVWQKSDYSTINEMYVDYTQQVLFPEVIEE